MNGAGVYGRAAEVSAGKDTTTGHWEIAGLRLDTPFPTYPNGFPPEVMNAFEAAIGTKTLGNYPASGTAILDELGEEHMRTGYPIVYTSADSVFQIACHEDVVPPERLYEMCRIARGILTGPNALGGVIARPSWARAEATLSARAAGATSLWSPLAPRCSMPSRITADSPWASARSRISSA